MVNRARYGLWGSWFGPGGLAMTRSSVLIRQPPSGPSSVTAILNAWSSSAALSLYV